MKATIELPKAFSVRDDREIPLIQDLMVTAESKALGRSSGDGGACRRRLHCQLGPCLHGRPAADGRGFGRRVEGGGAGCPAQRGNPAAANLGQQ